VWQKNTFRKSVAKTLLEKVWQKTLLKKYFLKKSMAKTLL
jgi:hypothetical protein